ncbi:MAG TPA: hypothetical protein VGD55_03240 [Acidothermaceae bacterium]
MAVNEPADDGHANDRMAALVAALLGVRIDHASVRFDAEVDAALAANRIDVQTARALRFWQRASVQAVEEYIGAALPGALTARDDADLQGSIDAAQAAAAWEQSQAALPTQPAERAPVVTPTQLRRRLVSLRVSPPSHRSAKETEQAVRAALQFAEMPFEGKDSGHARSATSA